MTLKEFFSQKRPKPISIRPGQSVKFAFIVWLIDFVMAVFLLSWIVKVSRLPEKYYELYTIVFSYCIVRAALIGLLIHHYKLAESDTGLKPSPMPLSRFATLFLLGAIIILLLNFFGLWYIFSPGSINWSVHKFSYIIIVLIMGPLFEELLYRGCLQTIFLKRFKSKTKAILLSALLFALGHFKILNERPKSGSYIGSTRQEQGAGKTFIGLSLPLEEFISSLIYGRFYLIGGSNIILPVALHSFKNVLGLISQAKEPQN